MDEEQRHYCMHLAEVNKTRSVVTSQDIYNTRGVLLLARGVDISEKQADLLMQHKLVKPLEECVAIESSFNAEQLFSYLNKFAEGVPGLFNVIDNSQYQEQLQHMCAYYARFPLIRQNLTVLAQRMPGLYFQGLFSAMAGLAIAIKLELGLLDKQAVFIAALLHDAGFLYLPPALGEKTHNFTAEEWKALQAHPLIMQRFLEMVTGLPKTVGVVIADHHERIDGTGFPRQSFGDSISICSQIIAATDSMIANHIRYHSYGEQAHHMLLTAIRFSDNIYFESVFNAAMLLFQSTPIAAAKNHQLPSISELLYRQKILQQNFASATALAQNLIKYTAHPLIRSINAVMARLGISLVRSGILQPEQEEWLRQLALDESQDHSLELLEVTVMHDQISDQLRHLQNLIERVVEDIPTAESKLKHLAQTALAQLDLNRQLHI